MDLKGRVVVFVQDSTRAVINNAVLTAIRAKSPAAIITMRNNNPAQMATQVANGLTGFGSGMVGMPRTGAVRPF